MKLDYRPDGIVITIGSAWLKKRGVIGWAKDFLTAMEKHEEGFTYWIRKSAKPSIEVPWVYLCIGGKIRYRCNLVEVSGAGWMEFDSGNRMYSRAWLVCAGPVVKAPYNIPFRGTQGFRYTEKLF